MLKRVLVVAVTATAISVPAISDAAAVKKAHQVKSHPFTVTVMLTNLNPPGALVASGSQEFTGSADGTIGGKAVHGAVRGTNTYSGLSFTGTTTLFAAQGDMTGTTTGTATVAASGAISFTGSLKITSGTGAYKRAKGTLPITGSTAGTDADGDGDGGAAMFTATGTVKY